MARVCEYCGKEMVVNRTGGSSKASQITNMCDDCKKLLDAFRTGSTKYRSGYEKGDVGKSLGEKDLEKLMRMLGYTLEKLEKIEDEINSRQPTAVKILENA